MAATAPHATVPAALKCQEEEEPPIITTEEDLANSGDVVAQILTVISRSVEDIDKVLKSPNVLQKLSDVTRVLASLMKVLKPAHAEILMLRQQVRLLQKELSAATNNHSKDSIHKLSRVDW